MNPSIVRAGAEVALGIAERAPHALAVSAQLFVDTVDGRRLRATGGAMGVHFGGVRPRSTAAQVTRPDVEQAINQMLGRDSSQSRPPHLAWEQIRAALDSEGIAITDDELIATPFVFEFSTELLSELDG